MTPIEQMRNPEHTLAELRIALRALAPENAQWWAYNVSHHWFMLRLYRPKTLIMVAMFGCQRICGPTAWERPSLQLELTCRPPPFDDEPWWMVNDSHAGFAVEGGHLYWGQDVGMFERSGWFSSNAQPNDASG